MHVCDNEQIEILFCIVPVIDQSIYIFGRDCYGLQKINNYAWLRFENLSCNFVRRGTLSDGALLYDGRRTQLTEQRIAAKCKIV